ncbi:MAG: acyl-CoA dehydrogenase family protein [Steroidobacteraceae bacterium]|nr:acyl-CoA dehydrogenase family protein [Nevskiaceae bacterium]MCP5339840.1 acyl-CoA dehydrogenase family protein [Nevskiaceae bacterium]MCP5359784.1 acyl-CoA dehydrogenase family protein [Nevskiaceae bacterium]MCP5467419.1 acyl-CoA dehydrogenase family protein [Nevskiaceae bacterium]MCP5472726.1 acyl-CoA dehydrogenase family protein [Nevskiaceae bacterium]
MSAPDPSAVDALRRDVRGWLERALDPGWRTRMTGATTAEFVAFQREWMHSLVAAGYATPHWQAGWPGGGRSLAEQRVIAEEMARADAPRLMLYFVSLYHAALTLMEWGSEAQKARHLPAILQGEVWCQGFSEPNAGSDLASLRTRAERHGSVYRVNGQKIWSTLAHHADYCLLLVRTDTSGPKQAGISFLLMDMRSKGVTVRPIRQITGDEEFGEIFLDDVEVPVSNRLGAENEGWRVAQTTLTSERGITILELSERLHHARRRLAALLAGDDGRGGDDQYRRELVQVCARIEALRGLVAELMAEIESGQASIAKAAFVKLFYARVLREFTDLALRAAGPDAQRLAPLVLAGGHETGNWMADYMNSFVWSIAGGSNEIQRNIIAERVLGMPRDAAVAR